MVEVYVRAIRIESTTISQPNKAGLRAILKWASQSAPVLDMFSPQQVERVEGFVETM